MDLNLISFDLIVTAESSKTQNTNYIFVGLKIVSEYSQCSGLKMFCCRDKILSPQHVAWNLAGLNLCIMNQGQNTSSIFITASYNCLWYNTCYASMCFVHISLHTVSSTCILCIYLRACPHITSSQHAP